MKRIVLLAALLAAPSFATSTGLPATLETKAKAAFADIAKAKTALDAGKPKTSQTYLSKSQTLLKSVLSKAPGGSALTKLNTADSAAKSGDAARSTNALSAAEGEAAKLDPSLAGKLGVAAQQTAQGDTASAQSPIAEARDTIAQKTGLSGLESTYQKVSLAQSLLKAGNNSKAKSLLDEIPSSPLEALKGL